MPSTTRYPHRLPIFVLGFLLAFFAVPSLAALPVADEQTVQRVVLNDGLLDKLIAIKTEGRALGIDDEEVDPAVLDSLDAMARAATRDSRVTGLLAKHGIGARDYAAASIALMRAGIAVQLGSSSTPAANGTTAANVAFARKRADRIQSLFADEDEDEDDGSE